MTPAALGIETVLQMRFFSRLSQASSQAGLLAGLVFSGLLLLLPGIAKYHGDECFYTDAAIRMLQSGDYLTPYAASGALRFAKPILPYWAVLAGYLGLGVNFLASRVLFLAAGCLVITCTYQLSIALFQRPVEGLLAALIMASNVQLLTISIRSTPDALLCLFTLLSLLGFARLLFQKDRSWKNYLLAYVGAGLAVETRGLPGVGVALFPFVFWALFQRREQRLRDLLEWKAVTLGLIVGLSWFGAMLWLHGRALLDGFYYDQVTENVRDFRSLDTLRNLQAYLLGMLRHFVPWSILLLAAILLVPGKSAGFWREHKSKCWFLSGWFLFILVPFVFGGSHRTRYMIVAYPSLAVLLAAMLSQYAAVEVWRHWLGRAVRWSALVFGFAGLLLAAAGLIADWRIAVAGLLWLLGGGLVWQATRRSDIGLVHLGLAALPFMAFWSIELLVRPVFSESPAPALSARLLPDPLATRKVYALNLSPSYQAQMRVLSGGRLRVAPLTLDAATEAALTAEPVVFGEEERPLVARQSGTIEPAGFAGGKWRGKDFLDLLNSKKRVALLSRNRVPFFIFFPATSQAPVRPIPSGNAREGTGSQ